MGERRLAAIMFTDIVGYTHLSQTDESLALDLLKEHQSILRPIFRAHRGTEVKTMGDAFLVEFRSALDAVVCAVDLQKKMAERNADIAPAKRLELRIGVHVGDVVHGSGDIYGDAVNLAARLEPLAQPGGICISQQVFDQIRNKTSFQIEKVGDVRLKNVELPQSVFRVEVETARRARDQGADARTRMAVLPFVNISPDPNDEYFADGLTEELISKLSEVKGLKVIARTSVMSYKRTGKKVSEIASELGVGSVIEGSVRKSGNKVRISVQLIDAASEEHLWSSNYDGDITDIFAIQSDVATSVAGALSTTLLSQDGRADTENVEAYTLYLKAMQVSYDTSEKSARETVALLRRAISLDPSFARAYAGLADALHLLGVLGYEDFTVMAKKAEVAAKKALRLDPELSEAHSAMANVHYMFDRFEKALSEAKAAVRVNPNLAEGYLSLGVLECVTRTAKDALVMFKKAYELDPLSPATGEMLANVAAWTGDDRLAVVTLERMRKVNPKNPKILIVMADYRMEKGEFKEAQRLVDAAGRLDSSDFAVTNSQAVLFALEGNAKRANAELARIRGRKPDSARMFGVLYVQTALGNLDEAFSMLMELAEIHAWPFSIRVDPFYREIRKDPRFKVFCRKVGIPARAG